MSQRPDFRHFVRYTDHFDLLQDAWVFIMQHVDEFGFPSIEISACHYEDEDQIRYEASVYGDVEGGW